MGKSTELEEKCENGLMIADYCGKVKDDYSQNKEANPLLVQRNSDFAPQNKEANPLLVQGNSDFAPQNKEDWL